MDTHKSELAAALVLIAHYSTITQAFMYRLNYVKCVISHSKLLFIEAFQQLFLFFFQCCLLSTGLMSTYSSGPLGAVGCVSEEKLTPQGGGYF